MKRAVVLCAFAVIALSFLLGSTTNKVAQPNPATLQLSIKPASEAEYQLLRRRVTPTSYFATVRVADENSKVIYGMASVTVEPGTRESATGKLNDGEVTLTVGIDRDVTQAVTEVTLTRNGEVVQRQKSDVMLRKAMR